MSEENPTAKSSNVPYVVAIIGFALLGVVAVLGITIAKPEADNTQLITIVLGFLSVIATGVMTFMRTTETHNTVNSDLAKWKQDFAAKHYELGAREGVEKEQARVAEMLKETVRVAVAESAAAAIAEVAKGGTTTVEVGTKEMMNTEVPRLLVGGAVDIEAKGATITKAKE